MIIATQSLNDLYSSNQTGKAIAENSARYIVRGVSEPIEFGATMRSRWADLGEEPVKKKDEPEDNRTCAEIAGDIWSRIRGD